MSQVDDPNAATSAPTSAATDRAGEPIEMGSAGLASPLPAGGVPANCKVFDAHHPPQEKLINDCVHCGFCLPTCPTYLLWREEMDSPRGRIYLMKMGLEGDVERMDRELRAALRPVSRLHGMRFGVSFGSAIRPAHRVDARAG